MNAKPALLACAACLCACGQDPKPDPSPPTAVGAIHESPAPAPVPALPAFEDPADPNEACARIVVVSYAGADHAPAPVTRDKAAAQARAGELRKDPRFSSDFAALAKAESDGESSGPRGGIMGTYTKETWPEAHAAIKDAVFALKVGQSAEQPIEAPYGFVLVQRCKVEKAHGRHVLIRYKGAKNAPATVKRGADDARKLAVQVQQKLSQGEDFGAVAAKYSEDGSKDRGGDLGTRGRGLLAPAFEQTLFSLKDGELSTVVETEFGFHVIQRLPEGAPEPAAP